MSNTVGVLHGIAAPDVDKIVRYALKVARLAAYRAVAHAADPARHPISADPGSLERLMLQRVQRKKPEVIARAMTRVMASMNAPAADRAKRFGDLAAIDLRSATSVEEQVHARPAPAGLGLDRARVQALIANHDLLLDDTLQTKGLAPQATLDNLYVRIHKVKCIDETDGFLGTEAGSDEILLGGTSVDETGDAKVVKPFLVAKGFDDGDSWTYKEPRVFTGFSLKEGGDHWPKTYLATMILCEEDEGGFPDWLKAALDKLKGVIAPLIGAAVGTAIGSVVPGLGNLVGAAIGALLGGLIQLFVDIWEDDVFPAWTSRVTISGYNQVFKESGKHTTLVHTFVTKGNGGKYQVWYDWNLHT